MWRAWRFAFVLIAGLGLLTWIALLAVNETTHRWFEKDVALRADLAVGGSRRAIVSHWRQRDWKELRAVLVEMTHDERIMGAAACSQDAKLVARTPDYPDRFGCADIGRNLQVKEGGAPSTAWRAPASLPGGRVHLSALPIGDD